MKQTLNEEINRIKSMMGCCKGKITENIEAGSQQEAEMIQIATQEIEYLGITQEDLNENNNDSKLFEIRRSKKLHKNHKAGHIDLQLLLDKRSNKT